MKYLLLIAIVAVAYFLWRNARVAERRARAPKAPAGPQEMVSCRVCSVHLPRGDAVAGADGRLYCSNEHRIASER